MISVHTFLNVRKSLDGRVINVAIVEVNQILFGTEMYVNTLNICVKFYVNISNPLVRNQQKG